MITGFMWVSSKSQCPFVQPFFATFYKLVGGNDSNVYIQSNALPFSVATVQWLVLNGDFRETVLPNVLLG
jgi:hypothetical protein